MTCDHMVTYNTGMDVEHVFKALADQHRRQLLDLLAHTDGQSLTELSLHLPMTRFGVMKHLGILEDAGLITSRKVGREKRHYLNSIPLQGVTNWAEQYRRFWNESMDRLEEQVRALQQKEGEH
ncbi:MAG: metalloregulator ArsR/SmtB family transcription factor [Herpetosiphon sp.]